jgi:hypothetical protein
VAGQSRHVARLELRCGGRGHRGSHVADDAYSYFTFALEISFDFCKLGFCEFLVTLRKRARFNRVQGLRV